MCPPMSGHNFLIFINILNRRDAGDAEFFSFVTPAEAGVQKGFYLDSGFRRNDEECVNF